MLENKKPIYVSKPYLPPLKELIPYLEQIWNSRVLTNNGPFLQEFEKKLSEYLCVPYLTVVVNGTSALEIAFECLDICGEVITTPYSFVATSQALLWKNIRPVFVDIEPYYCGIDPCRIEKAITKNTTAILPVHVYGYPCKTDQIQALADKYKLKVIYDAAHAFGVKYKGKSITSYGDLSILSFHATKVFNTFEGGAIICHDAETKKKLDAIRDFGFDNDNEIQQRGINAKMNEFQAAVGILQINYIDEVISRLKKLHSLYEDKLAGIRGLSLFGLPDETELNYSYFPVFVNENIYGHSRDLILAKLKVGGIHCRRYFYPLIHSLKPFKNYTLNNESLLTSMSKSEEVLCLPMYPDLTFEDINRIVYLLRQK